ncbi:hypothetical protein MMC25_003495 [Agyrium rufum]|nr:hypothetical protein [Agyrium rufum]
MDRDARIRNVNIMITTRPEFNIEELRLSGKIVTLEITASKKDLLEFVKVRLERERKLQQVIRRKPELESRILKEVPEDAQGMFLLAQLLMADLAASSRPSEVAAKLDNPPENLDQAYDASYSRIELQGGDEALCACAHHL